MGKREPSKATMQARLIRLGRVSNYVTEEFETKKFQTTSMDYTVPFTKTFKHLELSQYHDRFHKIYESLLNSMTLNIPDTF